MNIEPDIFDYLETTALEPHDDYTSEITYKDQKLIWNRLKEQEQKINQLKQESNFYHNEYIQEKTKNCKAREYIGKWKFEAGGNGADMCYEDIQELQDILESQV